MIRDKLREDEKTIERNRIFNHDDEGVSEVLGTILTLAITVVLFTSVFAAVTHLEAPEEREHADLDASIRRSDDMVYISIDHEGGGSLDMDDLTFIVLVDGDSYPYQRDDVIFEGQDPWSPGERVIIEEDEQNIPLYSNIELVIRNEDTGRIVYNTSLVDRDDEPLSIRWARIGYPFEWRDYAEPEEEIDIRAEISIDDDFELDSIRASVSTHDIFEEEEPIELTELRGNIYNRSVTIHSDAETRRYSVKIIAELAEEDFTVEEYVTLSVGIQTADLYRAELVVGDIDFDPGSPSHGDELTVTAEVYNQGRVNYTAEWTIKDDGEVVGEGVTTFRHGPAPTRISTSFDVEGHGPHEIKVNVSTEIHEGNEIGDDPEEDVEPRTSRKTVILHVDPHVMLVRDVLGQELREGRIMENALRGLNMDYSVRDISSEADIPDDPDEFRDELNESSVVIWMSGNRTDEINIGDPVARDAVHDFIEEDEGVFWLIGSNLDGVTYGDLGNKLGFTDFSYADLDEETVLEPGGEDGTYGEYDYAVGPGDDYLTMTDKAEDKDTLIDPDGSIYGVGYEPAEEQRTAVNSFLFENVMDPGQRSIMVSEVIGWLTNMTTRSGVDIAVSAQRIEPTAPMYMDEVEITATLRNNGPEDLYVTVRCVRNRGEEVLRPDERGAVYVPKDGGTNTTTFTWRAEELGVQEFIVHADYYNEIDEVNLRNNDITYKDLDVTDDIIEVNVHYSTLVVDADLSEYDAYDHNATKDVVDSFERLGHELGRDYEYYQVEGPVNDPGDGPTYDKMSEYNAVFWITGERNIDVFTTEDKTNLEEYVEQDSGANLMFIGEHILDFLDEDDFLEDVMGIDPDSIGIVGHDSNELRGNEDNPLSRGLKYELAGDSELNTFETLDAEVLFEDEDGIPLASINDDGSSKVIHMSVNLSRLTRPLVDEEMYEDWPSGEVDLSHQSAREEFVYTTLWQLGKRDGRAELRVVDHDIEFSADDPHTGRSYEIEVKVQNIGYRGTSSLIRIKEGEDYIGAETAFIEGSERESEEGSTYFEVEPGTTTVEITWRPSYAGQRDIRVRVDPLRRVREISEDGETEENKLMEFHNQAVVHQPVYFFYDDMEKDEANWEHDETLVNIDGSGALDFVDREDVDTDVVGDWSDEYSGMTYEDGTSVYGGEGSYETDESSVVEWTGGSSYSSPRSYWMPETPGDIEDIKPTDVVMAIDTSGSMHWGEESYWGETWANEEDSRMYQAVEAAIGFIEDMNEEDRLEVWTFHPYGYATPYQYLEFAEMNDDNKEDFIDALIDIREGEGAWEYDESKTWPYWGPVGGTPYYDVLGEAIQSAIDINAGEDNDRLEFVIGLGDGESNADEDYSPNADWGETTNDGGGASGWGTYEGLMNAPPMVYNIGFVSEELHPDYSEYPIAPYWDDHHNGEPETEEEMFDVGYTSPGDWQDKYGERVDDDEYGPAEEGDPYTGRYYFAEEAEDVQIVFEVIQDIIKEISTGDQGGLRNVPTDETRSRDEKITSTEDYDEVIEIESPSYFRFLTTPEIQTGETTAERLTFRNRFKMTQGTNGGIMYLWGNDGGDWSWEQDTRRYIRPDQSYTGNLHFDEVDNHSHEGGPMNDNGLIDRENELPYWAFNGRSGDGTFDWRYTSVDLSKYEEFMEDYDDIRVVFVLAQLGGVMPETGWQPEMGWYVDDIRLQVTREFEDEVPQDGDGYWMRVSRDDLDDIGFDNIPSGHLNDGYYDDHTPGEDGDGHYWMFARNDDGEPALPTGVDSSLYTTPIDLTNAENPEFSANLKFNMDSRSGVPPDGLRLEISQDDGRSWDSISYGIRSGWGVSGDDNHGGYSGESDEDYGWVDTTTLIRINGDLSGYRGENVIIRFRVFTNTSDTYEDVNYPKAVFIDDVFVREEGMDTLNSITKTADLTEDEKELQEGPFEEEVRNQAFEDRDINTNVDLFESRIEIRHKRNPGVMVTHNTRFESYVGTGDTSINTFSTSLKRREKI